jgi:hypothetical protein
MSRKKSLAKKRPEEVRVNWVVDLVDPPQPGVEQAEGNPGPEANLEPDADPVPEPGRESIQWRLGGVNVHLARALEIATAECANLAEKGAALAAELAEANGQLLADRARMREIEGVLKQVDALASSVVTENEQPAE